MNRIERLLIGIAVCSTCVLGCTTVEHRTGTDSGQATSREAGSKVVSITLPEVQRLLSVTLTRKQIEKRLGPPMFVSEGNRGNLMCEMPEKRFLSFCFKGPYICSAWFDKAEVIGTQPRTYTMDFVFEPEKQLYLFALDDERYAELKSFKARLRKLPANAIVEWQHSDVTMTDVKEPLGTEAETRLFEKFCRKAGIILIQYMGG
jgi:hypothetical protein